MVVYKKPIRDNKTIDCCVALGRLTKDIPEPKEARNGKLCTNGFSLAVRVYKNGNNTTEFFSLCAFENVAKRLKSVSNKVRDIQIEYTKKEYGVTTAEELIDKFPDAINAIKGLKGKQVYIEGAYKESTENGKVRKTIFIDQFDFANCLLFDESSENAPVNAPGNTPNNAPSETDVEPPEGFVQVDDDDELPF